MAKQTANDMRVGWIIQHNGKRYSILSTTKVKPGKGGAFVVADIRDIDSGNKGNNRWRAEDAVEKLTAEDISCQFLYSDGTNASFMRLDDYEQFVLAEEDLGEQAKFLQPDMNVTVNFIDGKPVAVAIPKTVMATVAETEPALKGQTQSGSGKPAILDNGVRITVPTFIEAGEKIIVNTETLEYSERAK
ncbi:MAG: elongation factor P [Rickettsiales bacterium]|jgi:elongation factor P|nr:elongation factor P [Rickettsiales bacterium]